MKSIINKGRRIRLGLVLCACLSGVIACESGEEPGRERGSPRASDAPLYAVSGYVFGDERENTYVHVIDSLDVSSLDSDEALEFPGRASIAAHGGYLYVADGESPVITRYAVSDHGALKKDGRLSFANYDLSSISLDDWSNVFINSKKAYLSNFDSGNLIVWNPETLEIEGEIDLPELRMRDLEIDGSTPVLSGKYLLRAVFWKNWDEYTSSHEQYLITIDTETDELTDMVSETRCPALSNHVDRDEEGNLYFSNWVYNVTETLVSDAPKSCALRVEAGERTFDQDWILEYAPLTEGREAAGFSYHRDDKGFVSVFHDERVTIDEMTDPQELALTNNWRLWSVDLKAKTAAPVEDVDYQAGAYSLLDVDGHTLLMIPTEDYVTTEVREVNADGSLEKRFDVQGFSYQVVKLR